MPFSHGMIVHAHEQKRLFRALVGKRSGQVALRRFRELVIDLVREDLSGRDGFGSHGALHCRCLSGATHRLEARSPLEPEDIEKLFMKLATPEHLLAVAAEGGIGPETRHLHVGRGLVHGGLPHWGCWCRSLVLARE